MWSLDGDTLIFPKDVSLTVGKNSNIRHLVLQVHYISKDNIPETGDTSGLVVEYQTEQTEFAAGNDVSHVLSLNLSRYCDSPHESRLPGRQLCDLLGLRLSSAR